MLKEFQLTLQRDYHKSVSWTWLAPAEDDGKCNMFVMVVWASNEALNCNRNGSGGISEGRPRLVR